MEQQADLLSEIIQRPNSVIRNGGPQLLRGMMLPLSPTMNTYWRRGTVFKKGSKTPLSVTYLSDSAKEYRKLIGEIVLTKRARFLTDKPLRMDVVVCFRDSRHSDLDNRLKGLWDSLQHAGVFCSDEQIKDLRLRAGPIMKGGRMIVSLWEVPDYSPDTVFKEAWG